jgi:DNA invertase Pin-like site-specific DNA recombinase
MLIGCARVSTLDQNLDLRLDALKKAGCEKIFTDKLSSAKADRPGLQEALAYLRPGDALMFWKLDRLTRSLHDLLNIFTDPSEETLRVWKAWMPATEAVSRPQT